MIRQPRTVTPERQKTKKVSFTTDQFAAWRNLTGADEGWGNPNKALWPPWVEEMQLAIWGCKSSSSSLGKVLGGRELHRKNLNMQRVSWKYSVAYWPMYACEEMHILLWSQRITGRDRDSWLSFLVHGSHRTKKEGRFLPSSRKLHN